MLPYRRYRALLGVCSKCDTCLSRTVGLRRLRVQHTELRKITFLAEDAAEGDFAREIESWDLIDAHLCSLMDRLHAVGYRLTLEVELRLMKTGDFPGKLGFARLLPAFREKGVVTITDAALGGRVVHCSTHNC